MSGAEKPPDLTLSDGPTVHHEGFVEKKGPKDKEYEKQWLMLIDNRMVSFSQRIAHRELNTTKPMESVTVDRNWDIKPDSKEKTKLAIKCKAGQFKFKMSTQDDRDNWWIRFYALSKREHPKVHLLPGQSIALQEIIESTKSTMSEPEVRSPMTKSPTTKTFIKQRSADKPSSQESENKTYHFYPEHLIQEFKDEFPIPPTWFLQVNRAQAEELLLNNPEHGSILIRKSESRRGEYSLSMRQDPPINNPHAQSVVKHFSFSWLSNPGTFKMAIEETQPEMKTMYDLLAFFIEKHGGNIRPLQTRDPSMLKIPQHPYELGLRVGVKDPENGESHQDTYLRPQRAAPEPPAKPRPDRQSLPASFNMVIGNDVGAEAGILHNRHSMAQGVSSVSSQSEATQYVVSSPDIPMYINVGRDKSPSVNADIDKNMQRRQNRFSTTALPNFPPDQTRAPRLPPPRQRSESTSDTPSTAFPYTSSITNIYNTPSGETFALQQPLKKRPLPTPANGRTRAKTTPVDMAAPTDFCEIPTSQKLLLIKKQDNEQLSMATKPTSQTGVSNQQSAFKQPVKYDEHCTGIGQATRSYIQPIPKPRQHCAGLPKPAQSDIHPIPRPRQHCAQAGFPKHAQGGSKIPESAELGEIFKKFGIKEDS